MDGLAEKKIRGGRGAAEKTDDYGRTIVRLGMRFGRTVHRDAFRLRGIKVKRYPRWPVEELSDEAMTTLKAALDATGVRGR